MIRKYFVNIFIANLFLIGLALTATGQGATKVSPQKSRDAYQSPVLTLTHQSALMKREMQFNAILPTSYKVEREKSYAVVYLLHGLGGNFKNWMARTKLAKYSTDYDIIFIAPEGKNGWYSDSGSVPTDMYESYLIQELVPEIDKRFRTKKTREGRAIAGLSMGGYGALKFGVKYADEFVLVGSFSGALRAAEWKEAELKVVGLKLLSRSILSVFGTPDSKVRKENNLFDLLESKTKTKGNNLPFFYLSCGTEDFLLKQNQDFAALLLKKRVRHEFRQLPGRHNWKFWDSQIKEFLYLTKKFVK